MNWYRRNVSFISKFAQFVFSVIKVKEYDNLQKHHTYFESLFLSNTFLEPLPDINDCMSFLVSSFVLDANSLPPTPFEKYKCLVCFSCKKIICQNEYVVNDSLQTATNKILINTASFIYPSLKNDLLCDKNKTNLICHTLMCKINDKLRASLTPWV